MMPRQILIHWDESMTLNHIKALTITLFLLTTAIATPPAMAAAAKFTGYPETIAELGSL
jgi:hypothetical protein